MDICYQWMIESKIAKNQWQALNIGGGLQLSECATLDEQKARCLLYRKWRPKTDVKNELLPSEVYALVLAGIDPDNVPPRQIEMMICSEGE